MKMSPNCSSLSLYDIAGTPGVAADVGHVNTPGPVSPRAPPAGGKYRASRGIAPLTGPAPPRAAPPDRSKGSRGTTSSPRR